MSVCQIIDVEKDLFGIDIALMSDESLSGTESGRDSHTSLAELFYPVI